ncbi:hypothetical protein Tco_0009755 [Tanacetum coccineum]
MFQQHHGESLFEAWTHFKDLLQKVPHHGIDLWLQVQILYDHVNQATRNAINHSASGQLREKSAEESWELMEELALYDNEKDMIEKKMDWNKPPKEGDGAWHNRIELIDPDGEKFDRVFQSIPITRKLYEKEKPSDIIDLEHFYDS